MAVTSTRRKSKPKPKPLVRAAELPAKKPIPVSNELLREMAKKSAPPQSWFEEPMLDIGASRRVKTKSPNSHKRTVKIPYVPHEVMLRIAKKNPPPQAWFDESEMPFLIERPSKRARR